MTGAVLPPSGKIHIPAFADIYRNTATSYKFLWTLAILEVVGSQAGQEIGASTLFGKMLKIAERPLNRYNLYFGPIDKIKNILRLPEYSKMRELLSHKHLGRFLPYRWLTPFFATQLRGAKDHAKNDLIRNLANKRLNEASPPPYGFKNKNREICIVLHPYWIDYLSSNLEIVKGWTLWNWASYLQERNPVIPAIIKKIAGSEERTSLAAEKKFWNKVIKQSGELTRCIYTDATLTVGNYDLDHFIPWDFIGHNHLWNLVPAESKANSMKGNNLPDIDRYLPNFVDMQHRALSVRKNKFPRRWNKLIEPYLSDLHVTVEELTDKDKLRKAYQDIIPPIASLAHVNQFSANWSYSQPQNTLFPDDD